MAIATPPRHLNWRSPWLFAVVALVLTVAIGVGLGFGLGVFRLGGSTGPAATESPRATPTSTAGSGPLLVIVDGTRISLVGMDGAEVAHVTSGPKFLFVGVIGSRVEYVDGGALKALHRDGKIETLMSGCGYCRPVSPTGQMGSLIISPDGTQFMWSDFETTGTSASGGTMYHSTLHLTGLDGRDRVVANLDAESSVLAAYRWDAGGAVVQHATMGIGSGLPFAGATGPVFLLDPATATLSPLWDSTSCQFMARAADGTIACVSRSPLALSVGRPPDLSISIPLDPSLFQGITGISFKPGSPATLLAVGGAREKLDQNGVMQGVIFNTNLADITAQGRITPFGPEGFRPVGTDWMWLDDGSLIEVSTAPGPAIGLGPAGPTFVVSPSGVVAQPAESGTPVGVLRG